MNRLDARTALPAAVQGPAVLPRHAGIVHLGIGAFHRAHQAVLTEDAVAATGDRRWGIVGVTQRSARVVEQLRAQDGRYGVLTLGADEPALRVVGSVVGVLDGSTEAARAVEALAAPTTHVVTMTVTEKGYVPDGPAVRLLVAGLRARRRAGGAPLTVVSCDNLVGNGRVLARVVRESVVGAGDADGTGLLAWVDSHVAFPSTMVDRIVPATGPEHHAVAESLLGARDEGLVVAEPFRQWVVEDAFAGPRPAWEAVGATLTSDVGPFEEAKLRLLNGTHTLLACGGLVLGHATLADAVGDPRLADAARALQREAVTTLTQPPGVDLARYADELLVRFANPSTGHRTAQVASDSTLKIPQRWGPALATLLARRPGTVPPGYASGLGAWVAAVVRAVAAAEGRVGDGAGSPANEAGADHPGRVAGVLDDPRATELRAAGRLPLAGAVAALLELPGVLPVEVARHDGLRAAVEQAAGDLLAQSG